MLVKLTLIVKSAKVLIVCVVVACNIIGILVRAQGRNHGL
jgi:hypothetical protein